MSQSNNNNNGDTQKDGASEAALTSKGLPVIAEQTFTDLDTQMKTGHPGRIMGEVLRDLMANDGGMRNILGVLQAEFANEPEQPVIFLQVSASAILLLRMEAQHLGITIPPISPRTLMELDAIDRGGERDRVVQDVFTRLRSENRYLLTLMALLALGYENRLDQRGGVLPPLNQK